MLLFETLALHRNADIEQRQCGLKALCNRLTGLAHVDSILAQRRQRERHGVLFNDCIIEEMQAG